MISPIYSLLNKVNYKKRPLNILSECYHETYSSLLASTGHNFFCIYGDGLKSWEFKTKPLPPNHYLIKDAYGRGIPPDLEFDLIISGHRNGNLQRALNVGQHFNVPVVHADHSLPDLSLDKYQLRELKKLRAQRHVFVGECSKIAWEGRPEDIIIPQAVDTNVFKGWHGSKKQGISVVNYLMQREPWCGTSIWCKVREKVPINLVGENGNLGQSAKSTQHLVDMLAESRVFIDTSQYSGAPLSTVEAMSVGCPVISTNKYEVSKYIKHGENGFLAATPEEIIDIANELFNNDALAERISKAARQTAVELFNLENFVESWNKIFEETYQIGRN